MEKIEASKSYGNSGVTMIATAIGAVAIGIFAIGALAIGRPSAIRGPFAAVYSHFVDSEPTAGAWQPVRDDPSSSHRSQVVGVSAPDHMVVRKCEERRR